MNLAFCIDTNFFINTSKQWDSHNLDLDELLADLNNRHRIFLPEVIVDELRSFELNMDYISEIITVDQIQIDRLKEQSSLSKNPQDNDIALVVTAEHIQKKYAVKYVYIISNDFLLSEFVNEVRADNFIRSISIPVACYFIASDSPIRDKWKNFGKISIDTYLKYNTDRFEASPIRVTRWILRQFTELLSGDNSDQSNFHSISHDDFNAVKQIIRGISIDKGYLSNVAKFIDDWRSLFPSPDIPIFPNDFTPHALPELLSEPDNQILESVKLAISLWNDLLLSSNLSDLGIGKLIEPICHENLVQLYSIELRYRVKFLFDDSIDPIAQRIIQFCVQTGNIDELYEMQLQIILGYYKTENIEEAKRRTRAAKLYHDKPVFLIQLAYLLGIMDYKTKSQEQYIKNQIKVDRDKALDTLQNLGDALFQSGIFEPSYKLLRIILLNEDYTNTSAIIKWYKQALLCDQMVNNTELRILEELHKLKQKSDKAKNHDLVQFFTAEISRQYQPSSTAIYALGQNLAYEELPGILTNRLDCMLVDDNHHIIISTSAGLFKIINFDSNLMTLGLKLHPNQYQLSLQAPIVIEEPDSDNIWIEGNIVVSNQPTIHN